ncbi:uncharacterized protein LOC133181518 [Saccostrea echinata]|uniref:uncharacterized protein LOC133181518 n=1 Tax=Saccostrea echinata TaxID=191078 RepID=UPI002A83F1F2|nr:uncharacterized protein LOC133181518 [Saccostrea echinata]
MDVSKLKAMHSGYHGLITRLLRISENEDENGKAEMIKVLEEKCGGRIHNAPLMEKTKFPYILPTEHRLTYLIVVDTHKCMFMPVGIRQLPYFMNNAGYQGFDIMWKGFLEDVSAVEKSYQAPEPPPLPKDRLQMKPPFTVKGIDFAGPLYVKDKLGEDSKAYICLFTCASSRALHLELVPNLTHSSFLLAFRRFISRRSLPSIMISDNATTFQSASKEIPRASHAENALVELHGMVDGGRN